MKKHYTFLLLLIFSITSFSLFGQMADLEVTKTIDDETPFVTQEVEYEIKVENHGPNRATGIIIQEVLPAGVTFVSADPEKGSFDPVSQQWDLGNLKDGEKKKLKLYVTIDAGTSGYVMTNTAYVGSVNQSDPITANNLASVDLTVNAPDLQMTKTVDDSTPDEGGEVRYEIKVKNVGEADATGVQVTDMLPLGVTFVAVESIEGDQSYDEVTGVWDVGSIEKGQEYKLKLDIIVDAGTNGQTITNTASVSALDQNDTDPGNDNASVDLIVNAPDLQMTKTVNDDTPDEGGEVRYEIKVKNVGEADATGVQVTDMLPVGVTFVAVESIEGDQTYDEVTGVWDVGSIEKGQEYKLKLDVTVDEGTNGQTITNTATVSALDQNDADPSNDSGSADFTVNAPDLKVTKTVNDDTPDEGQEIEYTIKVKNEGEATATGVVVSEILYEGLIYISDDSDGAYVFGFGNWTIGTIEEGDEVSLKIRVAPGAGTNGSTITNTASVVAMDQSDTNPGNNASSVDVTVNAPDLQVTKMVNEETPDEGDEVRYEIKVKNVGEADATGVQVTDMLPAGVTFVAIESIEGDQTYDEVSGVWDIGSIEKGQEYKLKLDVTVNAGWNGRTIINTASVSALDQNDTDPSNDSDFAEMIVNIIESEGGDLVSGNFGSSINHSLISKVEEISEISLFPNPTASNINVIFKTSQEEEINIEIVSLIGKVVMTEKVMATKGLNNSSLVLDQLNKGIYVVSIKTASNQFSKTFILE